MWKNNLFGAREAIKIGDCNYSLLLCHLTHVRGNQAKVCIEKMCIFKTVMPLLKYCYIKASSADLQSSNLSYLGDPLKISKTQKTVCFLNASKPCKFFHPSRQSIQMWIAKRPHRHCPLFTNPKSSLVLERTEININIVHMDGTEPIMSVSMICHTDSSLLLDRNTSFCWTLFFQYCKLIAINISLG
jgi:hypothetical protein